MKISEHVFENSWNLKIIKLIFRYMGVHVNFQFLKYLFQTISGVGINILYNIIIKENLRIFNFIKKILYYLNC